MDPHAASTAHPYGTITREIGQLKARMNSNQAQVLDQVESGGRQLY